MKRSLPLILAVASGLFVIIALVLQPQVGIYLNVVLNWAIIVLSMTMLVSIAILARTQWNRIAQGQKGALYSVVALSAFLISLFAGLLLGVDNPVYLKWIANIQLPLEASLTGLLAFVLTSAAVQVFRTRGWTLLSASFGISALLFLIISLGFLQLLKVPQLKAAISVLENLPLVGARGLLIGVAVGGLLISLRILLGMERPFGDQHER